MKNYSVTIVLILLGATGLLYPVYINGYPLVYSDSGTYIYSGYENFVPADRPIMYGLLIRHLGLGLGLKFYIVIQALLVSSSIYAACKLLVKDAKQWVNIAYTISLFLVLCCTTLPWVTSWMMPDIFSGVSALLLLVLLFSQKLGKQTSWIALLYVVLTLTHVSNIMAHLLALIVISILYIFYTLLFKSKCISLKRIVTVWVIVIANYALLLGVNYAVARKVFLSKGSDIFLTAKLCDDGLVNTYLENCCTDETPRLCTLKDSIQPRLDHFLWSSNSVLYKMGGWNEPSEEFAILNRNILTTPELLKVYVSKGLNNSIDQFFTFEVGQDFLNYGDSGSAPFGAINWFIKKEVPAFMQSKQSHSALNFSFNTLNCIQWCIILTLFVVAVLSLFLKVESSSKWILIAMFMLLAANAMVCAFLTSVGGRYQSRIIWIVVVVMVIETINNRKYFIKLFPNLKSQV
ncbi:hypothetical protein AEM51_01800 [Bacteroidetes bacterium UKL13-3]|nr:hypothetical protein AEM51_01800 [Bacteroidetes bacterium UKL13-3]HCP94029.1 hypothetical protein [Bacteroidota bacterium]